MADAHPSPSPNYLKFAFEDQHNLIALLGAACFSAAFASPLPLALGAAGELAWLTVGPRLPSFRDWVDEQLSEQYSARSEAAIEGALAELPEADVARFRTLSLTVEDVLAIARPRLTRVELHRARHGLLELRRTFLDYSFLSQRVLALADPTPTADLEREAARLQEEYGAERELTARMTIRKALGSVQKRMRQQSGLSGVKRNLEARLDLLDEALPQLKERLSDPTFTQLAEELDRALAEVGSADALEQTLDEIFDSPAAA